MQTYNLSAAAFLYHGDCRDALKRLPDNSIDSVVTDPPYALVSIVKRFGSPNAAPPKDYGPGNGLAAYARAARGFMGKSWDTGEVAMNAEFWAEVLRVLKPGGHVAAFGASRGYHRMACAIEDAGFEIRDSLLDIVRQDDAVAAFVDSLNDAQQEAFARTFEASQFGGTLAWLYGTGFPKGHNVAKAIDKAFGAEREKVRVDASLVRNPKATGAGRDGTDGATRPWIEAALERGYHEKDSDEPVTDEAREWEGWSTALKPAFEPIVLARKPLSEGTIAANVLRWRTGALNIDGCRVEANGELKSGVHVRKSGDVFSDDSCGLQGSFVYDGSKGRWPANIITDGSEEVVRAFPNSESRRSVITSKPGDIYGGGKGLPSHTDVYGFNDSGSAARFFYSAKASKADRNGSKHPTVKPITLMQWLARLITPPGGTVLDPFAGSGTTGAACAKEGFNCVMIEREDEYAADIRRRYDPNAKVPERTEGRKIYGVFADEKRPREVEAPSIVPEPAQQPIIKVAPPPY